MEPGKRNHTGGLRDGNPRRFLRPYAAGDPDGTRTDCPQAAHLIRQPTVRVSSFSHHQPAVMAITCELSQYLKYMARTRIPDFESSQPSHAVGLSQVRSPRRRLSGSPQPCCRREIQAHGVRSPTAIARELTARGVETAQGGKWQCAQVCNILRRVERN
jgi:hypothetical protein